MKTTTRTLPLALAALALPAFAAAQPLDCSRATASLTELAPADHSFATVVIEGLVDEDGDPADIEILEVTQDEPVEGTSADDACPDAMDGDDFNEVRLRAERQPDGDGRVYRVKFLADTVFEECEGTISVCVPRGNACVDSGNHVPSAPAQCTFVCPPDRCDAVCQTGCVGPPPDPCDAPSDQLVAVRCALEKAQRGGDCDGIAIPRRILKLLARANEAADAARGAQGRKAVRQVKRLQRNLDRLVRLLSRAGLQGRLDEVCAQTLTNGVLTARVAARAWLDAAR